MGFEIPALFSHICFLRCYVERKKRAGFLNPVKNRVIESCLFPSNRF